MLNGLSQINIELTSKCNKSCSWCGHQNYTVNPNLRYGDMGFDLLKSLALQVPPGIIVQFHRDGEPTVYPRLREALALFHAQIRSLVTNGKNLGDRASEILGSCERVTVSAFDPDPDGFGQLKQLYAFLERQRTAGAVLPAMNVKVVGSMRPAIWAQYEALGVPILRRLLHAPGGDWRYKKGAPTIPEVMICLDLLSHPSIDWEGNLYLCNRLQPQREGIIGNLKRDSLATLWHSSRRADWIRAHREMRRGDVPACHGCEFWGVPTGA